MEQLDRGIICSELQFDVVSEVLFSSYLSKFRLLLVYVLLNEIKLCDENKVIS